MAINLDEFSSLIKEQVKKYSNKIITNEKGYVVSINDGIVKASGLDDVILNELVRFENGSFGIAFNLEANSVGIVMLGKYFDIHEGSLVERTKHVIETPVGDALIGRVVNGIGMPIDGKGELKDITYEPIEKIAPELWIDNL